MEQQKNQNKVTEAFNALAQKHMKEIYKMRKANDQDGLYALQDTLFIQAEAEAAKQPDFHFTPEQIKAYTTVGGTPHLMVNILFLAKLSRAWTLLTKSSR